MTPYTTGVDVANRALQRVGMPRISAFTQTNRQAAETAFCYDKLRTAELRRAVWRFATRRAVLRKITSTTKRCLFPTYAAGTTYGLGFVVKDSDGILWQSQRASNLANTPGDVTQGTPSPWQQYFGPLFGDVYDAAVTYYMGDVVYTAGSPNLWYVAIQNNFSAKTPASEATYWVAITSATDYVAAGFFQTVAGPSVTISNRSRNLYPLPNGFLRPAPPDPKVGASANLQTSAGLRISDWEFENNYIVSNDSGPIIFRFVADVSDVTLFDPLFAEGLAARIAYDVCEILTGSNVKLQAIGAAYQKFIHDAALVNWIETGSTEPMEEEYTLTKGPAGVQEAQTRPTGG